jgi:PAS domain S-box-containing protein
MCEAPPGDQPRPGETPPGETLLAECAAARVRVEELEAVRSALQDRLELLDLIFQGDRLAAYDWQLDSGEIVFDRQLGSLLGQTRETWALGLEQWHDLQHPEDRDRVLSVLQEFRAGRVSHLDVEYRIQQRQGVWLWVRDRCRPVDVDSTGRPLRARGALRDIDARRRAEDGLRESERKYRSVIENIVDVFYRSDAQGRLLMGSPSGARMFGYGSVEEMVGLPLEMFWPDPEERNRLLEEVRAKGRVLDFEAVLRRKDGSTFHASFSTHFYYDEEGRVLGTEGIIRDISERKRAVAERLDLERRLLHAQKLESLGVLAGGIAHDFNNLLMAILGNLDISLSRLAPGSPARERIEQAMRAARRATDLTRQMLAYSGKGRFSVEPLDLSALVRENADLFRSAVPRSVTMDLRLTATGCLVQADPGQVQQIIMNLITNAAEAIEKGPGTITLSTSVIACDARFLAESRLDEKPPPGEFVCLEVADDGGGMDGRTAQRLFDPFFTTKFTGRGLGMSAVLGIVRGHNGAILVDSAAGWGTKIRVLFPVCAPGALETEPQPTTLGQASPVPAAAGKILVVDDDPSVRELCAEYVELLGYSTLTAADGEAAVALMRSQPQEIVCVLLDLTMPRMDGLSTLRALRGMGSSVTVLLCSGFDEQDATQRFANESFSGFLQKPYLLPELKAKLEQALRDSGPGAS